jgi:hypothetical protein
VSGAAIAALKASAKAVDAGGGVKSGMAYSSVNVGSISTFWFIGNANATMKSMAIW